MKYIITIISFLICLIATSTNYYWSNAGADGNPGTLASPFATITKFNSFFSSLSPGDSCLFRRGDTFYGAMIISRSGTSGSRIKIGAYSSGAKPIITGFTTLSAWTNLGSNIWETTSAASTLSYTNMVVISGVNTPMGRTPNTGSTYTYQSHSGNTSITSSGLSGSPNWTGAELSYFITTYTIGRNPITAQSGGTLTYTPNASDAGIQFDNQTFFIQADSRTLDVQNEWYYNTSTKKLRVYSVGSPSGVQIPTIESLVTISYFNYITFDNLSFQGSNTSTFALTGPTGITIQNCDMDFAGKNTIYGPYGGANTGLTLTGNTINHSNNCGVTVSGDFASAVITNNTVTNSGVIPGMMSNGGNAAEGIYAQGAGSNVGYNTIDSSGYNGMFFFGNNSIAEYNYINHSCINLKDGGGIYTFNGWPNTVQTGMIVRYNTILNTETDAAIYMDDLSNGVEIYGNNVANNDWGIYLHNNYNINVHNNTTYNSTRANFLIDNYNGTASNNITINSNIFCATATTERTAWMALINGTIASTFTLDSNYYARPLLETNTILTNFNQVYTDRTLAQWKTLSARDAHSKTAPITVDNVNKIRFEYNETGTPVVVSLGVNSYMDMYGTVYSTNITVPAYSSVVLLQTTAVNSLPLVSAGVDQSITLPTSSVTMAGTTTDPDGSIVSRVWTKLIGGAATITTPSSNTTTITGLVVGSYQFQLCATDNSGATVCDQMNVTVNAAANVPPIANAGADKNITLPTSSVTQVGSGTDADGSITGYLWTLITSPAGSAPVIVNAGQATTLINNLIVAGTYTFQLRVTDNVGATATDQMFVTVNNPANQPPVIAPGPNQTLTLPTTSSVFAGNATDPDGTIVSHTWSFISGPGATPTITTPSSYTSTVTGMTIAGSYTFQLSATDNLGATSTSSMVILVNPAANVLPIANAGTDKNITLPTNTITQVGSGTDADGTIVAYLWTYISGPATYTIVNASQPTTVINNLIAGTYVFQLRVTDNSGATATDQMTVLVNPPANLPPVANAGPNQTITLPTSTATLAGSATDPDGTISSHTWSFISGVTTATVTTPSSYTSGVTGMSVAGSYTFQLLAIDNSGARDSARMTILVNPAANLPPIANAGADQSIAVGITTTTLLGSGTDADGTIISYLWTNVYSYNPYNIVSPSQPTTVVNGLGTGVFKFQLRVVDNNGASAVDTMTVIVDSVSYPSPGWYAPIANAGADQKATINLFGSYGSATATGSGTSASGFISSYAWTQVSGPNTATINSPTSATTVLSHLVRGSYVFQLTVTDNNDYTGTDTMIVTVTKYIITIKKGKIKIVDY